MNKDGIVVAAPFLLPAIVQGGYRKDLRATILKREI